MAKAVKIASSLLLVGAVLGIAFGAPSMIAGPAFLIGLLGFVVGRFME